jgi:hypothetical protein
MRAAAAVRCSIPFRALAVGISPKAEALALSDEPEGGCLIEPYLRAAIIVWSWHSEAGSNH